MKKISLFSAAILVATMLASNVSAQFLRSGGEVVEIINGRTVVVALPTGKVKVELQHIEVPEDGQALHQTVKDHLQKLLVGKTVQFSPRSMVGGKTIGQLFLNGVDVSQQMLRDGAAWHAPVETTGQDSEQFTAYKAIEANAKAERRGVWSIKGMMPAWEYRAEILRFKREQEEAGKRAYAKADRKSAQKPASTPKADFTGVGTWENYAGAMSTEARGLHTEYEPRLGLGTIRTSSMPIEVVADKVKQKLELRTVYVYLDAPDGSRKGAYILAFLATSNKFQFEKSNNLVVTAGKQVFKLRPDRRFPNSGEYGAEELLLYEISKSTLEKMAEAEKLEIKIGQFSGVIKKDSKDLMKQLLAASAKN